MPSPMFNVAQLTRAVRYTGTNSADIDLQVPNVTIVSESEGVLVLDHNGNLLRVNTGDWVLFNVNGNFVLPDTLYVAEWNCVSICAELEALAARVDALENP